MSGSEFASIIIRTTGTSINLLQNAIQSVIDQTYKFIEIIVVQDGGNDAQSIVEKLGNSSTKNLIYIPCKKAGRSAAGNHGLSAATGEYLGFLDDDDELLPNHIALLVAKLKHNPETSAVFAQSWQTNVASESRLVSSLENIVKERAGRQNFSKLALMFKNYLPIQSVLFRRSLFDELNGFDEDLDTLEDWDLWIRYAAAHDFLSIPETTSIFRIPSSHNAIIDREKEHYKSIQKIRLKQMEMRLLIDGKDVLDEYNNLASKIFLGGRFLRWWLRIQEIRFRLFNSKNF